MKRKTMKTMMQGAVLLSVASLIAKILSAVYRVPFQNMVGNTGFYVYQQIYPIYGIGMTFALSGLPMFISKLVAESGTQAEKLSLLSRVLVLMMGFSLILFAGLQLFALQISVAMGDSRLAVIIRSVSWMFLLSPFLAVSRGYFQGEYDMRPSATSQLVEQLVRVTVILTVAYWAMCHQWDVYQMGAWAMSSAAIAAAVASVVMMWYVRQVQVNFWQPALQPARISYSDLAKRLLIEGGTISLFASMMVLLQLIDSFTVKRGLVGYGLTDLAAKSVKGIYDRGQPLVQLGLVVATAFASSLLPSLTEALNQRKWHQFVRQAGSVIRMSLVIATAAAAGLIALMPEVNRLLFGDTTGSGTLSIYVLSIIFATLITIYNSILQSLNRFTTTLVGLGIGLAVKVIFNQRSVVSLGAVGASWTTVIALAAMTIFLMQQLREFDFAAFRNGLLRKLVVICLAMIVGLRVLMAILQGMMFQAGLSPRGSALLLTIIGVGAGVWFFLKLALKTHLLALREWLMLPLASRWLRWLRVK